jgi:polyisoprenoid-binding protein YceI
MRSSAFMLALCALGPAASSMPLAAATTGPVWRVAHGEIRVVCPLTVGGSFEAKTAALAGTLEESTPHPATFEGSLTADLSTLDTGIGLRSEHLREEYLEVGKGSGFDAAVLSDIHLGDVDATNFQGRTDFSGTFLVHGTKQTVRGQAEIRRQGPVVRIEATFPVTLADYGIPKPQYLGIGVKDQVQVKVSLVAMPVARAAGGGR